MDELIDLHTVLADFYRAFNHAVHDKARPDIILNHCQSHQFQIPDGCAYVYLFKSAANNSFLKIGKAGPKSKPRLYQHYFVGSTKSCLARSIIVDPERVGLATPPVDPGAWIKEHTHLYVLLIADTDPFFRSFLEAFLHLRLRPVYEKG